MHPSILMNKIGSPHAGRLERWLGPELMGQVERSIAGVYHPLPVANGMGPLWGYQGDLYGRSPVGAAADLKQWTVDVLRRAIRKEARSGTARAGFTSLSDAISEATVGGKLQTYPFYKTGATGVVAVSNSLWRLGASPAAGTLGAALAGGTTYSRTSTGAIGPQVNATGGDFLHLMMADILSSVAPNTLLLHDRLWAGAPAMNSAANQTVTYTRPTRYGDTEVAGSVVWLAVGGTALANTAHNIDWQYTDQDGNTVITAPTTAGVAQAIADRFDHANWFLPLAAGDTGVRVITRFTCSATVATGVMDLVHAMPLAIMPTYVANTTYSHNFFGSLFRPVRIKDDACLALIEIAKSATGATNYAGLLTLCAG